MDMNQQEYRAFAKAHAPRSPIFKDCLNAFWVGGTICTLAQGLTLLYTRLLAGDEQTAGTLTSVTLVFLAALLTGLGWFVKIAKVAGAGTLVPIPGFANSVVSPAIDSKAEGLVLGVGAKMFTVAGPVIVYGTLASVAYGVIYFITTLF